MTVGSYYFFIAQLPTPMYGQAIPMSSAAFKEMAQLYMTRSEAKDLEFCTLEPISDKRTLKAVASSRFIKDWHNWETVLRQNLARNRSRKLKWEGSDLWETIDDIADAAAAAKTALAMDSPLEAELFLDRARWNIIEQFQGIVYFSENTIYAYLLKLKLMERRQAFNMEEGFAEYKTLYASILENAGEPK